MSLPEAAKDEGDARVDNFRALAVSAHLGAHLPLFLKLMGYYLLISGFIVLMMCFYVASLDAPCPQSFEAWLEGALLLLPLAALNMLLDAFLQPLCEAAMTHTIAVICVGHRPALSVSWKNAVVRSAAPRSASVAAHLLLLTGGLSAPFCFK